MYCLAESCGAVRKEELGQIDWTGACCDDFAHFSSHSLLFSVKCSN